MKRKWVRFLLLGSLLAVCNVLAFVRADMPLEQKVANSDVVIIGSVVMQRVYDDRLHFRELVARVHVETVLKGDPETFIEVRYDSDMPEMTPECCEANKTYLLFLAKMPGSDIYRITSGGFGAYPIMGADFAADWPGKPSSPKAARVVR
ncbi:hypothetical protein FHW69_001246 [Luteibacter sp. Sphag1AF]|uniref:hypothetical protein n=1 Tax=Luteibacter sp. Sphag1AF TaxID=2587031 RepID=UPI00161EC04C|nr:hypothetical protein [Luteibacter sp. Sphag1AF]MBB3226656.1 hypothetical protein [Luteibacter sp. Sphag1AF]